MRALILLGALLFGSAAWSQDTVEGPYVGVGLGTFDYEFTLGPTTASFSDSTTLRKLYGGFRFNERWAIEGSYSSTSTLQGDLAGFPITIDYDIIGARGLAHFRTFYVGMGYWNADVDLSSMFTSVFPVTDSDVSAVLGGEWSFKDNWGFRLEYERFDVDGSSQSDPDALSLGIHYKFG